MNVRRGGGRCLSGRLLTTTGDGCVCVCVKNGRGGLLTAVPCAT